MKILKALILIFTITLFTNCNSDDDTTVITPTPNGFNFDGNFYPLAFALTVDNDLVTNNITRLELILASKDIESTINGGSITDVNYVNLRYDGTAIQAETITLIEDYVIAESLNINGDSYTGGTQIIEDNETGLEITSGEIKINSVNDTQINLDFTITREDNKVITGHFEGNYSYID